jgi:hypothetical protein
MISDTAASLICSLMALWGWSNAGLVRDGDQSLLVDTLFDLPLTAHMLKTMRGAGRERGISLLRIDIGDNRRRREKRAGEGKAHHADAQSSEIGVYSWQHEHRTQADSGKTADISASHFSKARDLIGRHFADIGRCLT